MHITLNSKRPTQMINLSTNDDFKDTQQQQNVLTGLSRANNTKSKKTFTFVAAKHREA